MLRLGGGVGGSVLVATPDSVYSTFSELQLLMPQHHIHIPRLQLRLRLPLTVDASVQTSGRCQPQIVRARVRTDS